MRACEKTSAPPATAPAATSAQNWNRGQGEIRKPKTFLGRNVSISAYTDLVKLPPQATAEPPPKKGKLKERSVDRRQLCWAPTDRDQLIAKDHPARAISQMLERLDVSEFEKNAKSWVGESGRPRWSTRMVMSVLLYGYSQGIASARKLERQQEYEPGLRWLCCDEVINHHTLSSFRVGHEEALTNLFAQILGVLSAEGLVDLQTVMVDGTKVEAVAGKESYRRRGTVEQHLEQAREHLKQLLAESEHESEQADQRRQAAKERVAEERVERLTASLQELAAREAAARSESDREKLRVSETEAAARKMKFENGGWDLAYNVQVSTEASNKIVVGVEVSTAANDLHELKGAVEGVQSNCQQLPQQVVADTGYASRDNVEEMDKQGIEFIAPWKEDQSREAGACKANGIELEFAGSTFAAHADGDGLICKAGKKLVQIGARVHHGQNCVVYEAVAEDCGSCEWRAGCCGKRGGPRRVERVVESEAMKRYLERMADPATKELYKRRKEVAEFPHLWNKAVLGLRRFLVRGPTKAKMEATWMAISYNITRWTCVNRARQMGMVAAA